MGRRAPSLSLLSAVSLLLLTWLCRGHLEFPCLRRPRVCPLERWDWERGETARAVSVLSSVGLGQNAEWDRSGVGPGTLHFQQGEALHLGQGPHFGSQAGICGIALNTACLVCSWCWHRLSLSLSFLTSSLLKLKGF